MSGRGSTRSRKAAAESATATATADSTTATPAIDVEALTVADFRKELKNHSVDAKGFEEAVKNLTDAIEAKQKAAAAPTPAPAPAPAPAPTTTTTAVATPAKTEEPELDVASLTVVQLKAELEKRGLDTKGLKAELAKRLTAALAAPTTPATTIATTVATTTATEPATTTTTTTTAPVVAPVTTPTTSPVTTPATSTTADPKKRAVEKLREEAAAEAKKPRQSVVDELCPYARTAKVVNDMDCMLNQTNVGKNNNKFYVIQLLDNGGSYGVWTRWGRVGEPGQNAYNGSGSDLNSATKDFEKKFHDKTKNHWNKRDAFVPVDGKYTYLGPVGGKSTTEKPATVHVSPKKTRPSTLSANIQDMVNLIFDLNMFKHSMEKLEINTEELPLGKIQKSQILKGYDILEELEAAINKKSRPDISKWTSAFYTNIPHAFGRRVPPLIDDIGTVNSKRDLLNVLSDIEVAQGMMNEQKAKEEEVTDSSLPPNPLDTQYSTMDCTIEDVLPGTETFNILETYMRETGSKGWRQGKIIHAYTVDRRSEKQRFSLHDSITNRKLLWHGTNVAVVAAILKTGLRIMPHSGGRVGKGIYFASEHSKSAGYVGTSPKNVGFMFLVEVALGREHHITCDDSSLKAAPPGFDCIIAKGHTEPDPSKDITIDIEGKKVVVPQGSVIKMPAYQKSTFSQSEYLVYKESQARLRYILMIQF